MLFLHIGLPKTGTSLLQRIVFPRWKAITFFHNPTILDFAREPRKDVTLISHEALYCNVGNAFQDKLSGDDIHGLMGDWRIQQRSIGMLRQVFPGARIILSVRRHEDLILSEYKQYLQQGGTKAFSQFFSFDGPTILQPDNWKFRRTIELVQDIFGQTPFLLFQEDLRDNFQLTLKSLADFMGVEPPDISDQEVKARTTMDRRILNVGVGKYQAQVLRWLNRFSRSPYNTKGILPLYGTTARLLGWDLRTQAQGGLLGGLLPFRPMKLPEDLRAQIDAYYQDDWHYVRAIKIPLPLAG